MVRLFGPARLVDCVSDGAVVIAKAILLAQGGGVVFQMVLPQVRGRRTERALINSLRSG
jgi:hypothetical protein